MRVSRRQLAVIIDKLLETKSSSKVAEEVAAYLLTTGRTSELNPVTREVMELRAERGQLEATVTSAHELDDKSLTDIKSTIRKIRPSAKSLVLNKRVAPGLLGGLKLNVINDQLDLSIRAKLNKFKELTNERGV